jgi:hypothetical protein
MSQDFLFNQSLRRKASAKMAKIAFVGPLYLLDVIWGAVSLHAWLYISCGVAAFQILSHCLRKYGLAPARL